MLHMLLRMHKQYELGGKILTLGVADIHGSYAEMERVIKSENVHYKAVAPSERKTSLSKRQTELSLLFGNIAFMHQDDLFKMLGFDKVESMDGFDNENPTYVHDLNNPVPLCLCTINITSCWTWGLLTMFLM